MYTCTQLCTHAHNYVHMHTMQVSTQVTQVLRWNDCMLVVAAATTDGPETTGVGDLNRATGVGDLNRRMWRPGRSLPAGVCNLSCRPECGLKLFVLWYRLVRGIVGAAAQSAPVPGGARQPGVTQHVLRRQAVLGLLLQQAPTSRGKLE